MFSLDLPLLVALGVSSTVATIYVEALQDACDRFSINTPERIAGFLGQACVESRFFSVVEEDLNYTTAARVVAMFHQEIPTEGAALAYLRNPEKLANTVYANKNGNGNAASGDGWRFHGRGPIQTTGATNYAAAAAACGRPYVLQPDALKQPNDGCLAAAFFFQSRGGNALADQQAWDKITRIVNGPAMDQSGLRHALSVKALGILQPVSKGNV